MRGASQSRLRLLLGVAACCLTAAIGLSQMRSRVSAEYEHEMQDPVDDPPDAGDKGEFQLGRLRYRSPMDGGRYSRWGIDANKGDRLFIGILRRLTRIDVQSVETVIDVDSDQIFDHPFLFAVSVGDWEISSAQAERLKKYFERGGFLMVDDFHNEREWENFMDGVRRFSPGASILELTDDDPAFHALYNMKNRIRVPGANVVHGSGVERSGFDPHWRAARDANGRMFIAISFNQDVGDGWEFADDPNYPEKFSTQAIQIGTNYVIYAMTH